MAAIKFDNGRDAGKLVTKGQREAIDPQNRERRALDRASRNRIWLFCGR